MCGSLSVADRNCGCAMRSNQQPDYGLNTLMAPDSAIRATFASPLRNLPGRRRSITPNSHFPARIRHPFTLRETSISPTALLHCYESGGIVCGGISPFLFAILFLFGATIARATIFGGVRGIVHDPQHKPVANASLTLKSATSDWSQETQSNADGEFTFSTVPVGDYVVTVSQPGFDKIAQPVTVASDSSPIVHFMLEISAAHQTVTVNAMADMAKH